MADLTELQSAQTVQLTDTTGTNAAKINTALPSAADPAITVREASQGQQAMANSHPVAIASDQSAVPVSGTVTANIGTSGSLALDASVANLSLSQASTTSGEKGVLIQGAVTTAAPSYTTAQTNPLSLNTSGGLRVDGSGSTQPVSGTVTANAGSGTFTTADNQTITDNNAFTDGTSKVLTAGFILDEVAGTALTENDAAAARIDAKRAQVFVIEDTTTRGQRATVTASNALKVDGSAVTQPVSGTVTANIGTSGSLALDASVANLSLSQASTTSGEKGVLIQGAVTTSAPSYTTAQTNPLSLTTTGNLRVDGSSVTQPISGTITANAGSGNFGVNLTQVSGSSVSTAATGIQKVGIADSSGTSITLGQTTMTTSVPVTIASNQSTIATSNSETLTDNAGFTDGTSKVFPTGYVFDEVAGTALTENDIAAARVDAKRSQVFVIEDSTTRGQRTTVTASNALKVDGSAVTQPVSGTITANIGTSGSLALDASVSGLSLSQASTTSGEKGVLIQGAVTTAAPSYTTAQTNPLSLTTAGNLRVDGSSVTQPVSGTVTANAGSGTFTTADNQTITDNNAFTDGTSKVMMGGFVFDEVAGTALTENDAAAARIDAKRSQVFVIEDTTTRGQRATVTASNALKVDGSAVTQPVSGTVTANIGTSGSLALDTSVANLSLSQASTTSGEKGVLIQGAVTTAAPSYTTAQTNPLSLTTAGNLRVDGSSVTQPVSGTVATNSEKAEDSGHSSGQTGNFVLGVRNDADSTFTNTDLDYSPISLDKTGRVKTLIGSIDATTGTITSNSSTITTGSVLNTDGCTISINGTYAGVTAVFEASDDSGSNWYTVNGWRLDGSGNDGLTTLTNSSILFGVFYGVATTFRVRATAYTSGTANIRITPGSGYTNFTNYVQGTTASGGTTLSNPVLVGGITRTTNPSAATNLSCANIAIDKIGRIIAVTQHCRDLTTKNYTQLTTTTETTILATGGAGVFHDVTSISLVVTGGTTIITIRDATAGSTILISRLTSNVPFEYIFNPPLSQTTANNNWTAQLNAANTCDITITAVKNV